MFRLSPLQITFNIIPYILELPATLQLRADIQSLVTIPEDILTMDNNLAGFSTYGEEINNYMLESMEYMQLSFEKATFCY